MRDAGAAILLSKEAAGEELYDAIATLLPRGPARRNFHA